MAPRFPDADDGVQGRGGDRGGWREFVRHLLNFHAYYFHFFKDLCSKLVYFLKTFLVIEVCLLLLLYVFL